MSITVYSKPGCVQCATTIRALERADLAFEVVDLTADAEALRHVTDDLGYAAAPVVEAHTVEGEAISWTGFRPDLIDELKTSRAQVSDDTARYAGPFCGCRDYSCPAMHDDAAECVNAQ